MWEQIFRRWIDLVFWWLPKHEAAQRSAPQASQPDADGAPKREAAQAKAPAAAGIPEGTSQPKQANAPSARKQAPQARAPAREAVSAQPAAEHAAARTAADDLTVIKGIGPAVQKKLHALGIRTFHDLAAADPETLVKQLKGRQPISQVQVRSWTKAADQHTAARH